MSDIKTNKQVTPKASAAKAASESFVSAPTNILLWIVSFVIIVLAIGGNFYYANHVVVDESTLARLLRVLLVIVSIVVALIIALFTNKGHRLLKFSKEAYVELKKVMWPTRQEAVQTTFIVFIAVCVVALCLYLFDALFLQIVRAITL